jgi:hypothetical protein
MGWSEYLASAVHPSSAEELVAFYVGWISLFIGINLLWDVLSPRTPVFHLHNVRDKTGTLYAASTFSTSLLLLISPFDSEVKDLVGDTTLPIILAGMTGLFHSIGEICPYGPGARA